MVRFLRENWVWIVAPIVIVAVAIGAVLWFGESDPSAPHMYNVR